MKAKKSKNAVRAVALLLCLAFVFCTIGNAAFEPQNDSNAASPSGASVDPNMLHITSGGDGKWEINRGSTKTMSVSGAKAVGVTFTTSNNAVVSCTKSGKITGIGEGIATITATTSDGQYYSICKVACLTRINPAAVLNSRWFINLAFSFPQLSSIMRLLLVRKDISVIGEIGSYYYVEYDGSYFYMLKTLMKQKANGHYQMTINHYYDQGYDMRFGNAKARIEEYCNEFRQIMLELFDLEITSNIESCTSSADSCKIMTYGSVSSTHLADPCPKNGRHNSNSCLTTEALRNSLTLSKGFGSGTVSNMLWTGHIMDNDAPSISYGFNHSVIFTTANTVSRLNNYTNKSNSEIRRLSLYELIHETAHQLGLHDHYCYGIQVDKIICSNPNCAVCHPELMTFSQCVMFDIPRFENTPTDSLFCRECKAAIKEHIKNHH